MRLTRYVTLVLIAFAAVSAARADWIRQNTGTFATLRDIAFSSQTTGWIIGSDGLMLRTDDGGRTWVQQKKFTNDAFVQIHFINEKTGWLLCERNFYARGSNATSYLRKTTDGGTTWDKIEFEDGGRERVTKLLFNPNGTATAFGEGGVFYRLQEDGTTWKKVQTAIHFLLLGGSFGNEMIGAIAGAGGTIMYTEDSGFTWQKATLLGETDTRFNAVFFTGTKGAWAVGTKGRIFRSNGGARLWRQQDSTVTANLNSVFFTSPTNGWAVGEAGIIVRTRDGGQTWTDVPSGVTNQLTKVVFAGGRGWAIGGGGTVLNYYEGVRVTDPQKPELLRRN